MGILNITPDSFYDGGQNQQNSATIKRTEVMLNNGVSFIDIGGYSSRPGAADITLDQELKRVLPVIEALSKTFGDIVISIDTFRAQVAKAAIEAGAALVNDISAGL